MRKHVDILIDRLKEELSETRFIGEELAVLTQCSRAGVLFPFLSDELQNELIAFSGSPVRKTPKFTFIDVFAGIGGFRLGLEAFGGHCVFSSEWENTAKQFYFKNYKEMPYGDINNFTNKNISDRELDALIPEHELLASGFPCQPFSLAGVSARGSLGMPHGFQCKTQGTLFYSIERIASVKQPKILFLENVKNIISHDKGRTFSTIKDTIERIGYQFFYSIMNSETLVPQRRQRCFMVCVRNDVWKKHGDFMFPVFEGSAIPLKSILDDNPDPSYTISRKLWQGHKDRSERNKNRGTGFTTGKADLEKPSNTIVARYGKDGKECLIPQKRKNPRKLTINECRKLFGYPKNFKLPEAKTAAYRLFGNSVVVPVVKKVASNIFNHYFSSGDTAR